MSISWRRIISKSMIKHNFQFKRNYSLPNLLIVRCSLRMKLQRGMFNDGKPTTNNFIAKRRVLFLLKTFKKPFSCVIKTFLSVNVKFTKCLWVNLWRIHKLFVFVFLSQFLTEVIRTSIVLKNFLLHNVLTVPIQQLFLRKLIWEKTWIYNI